MLDICIEKVVYDICDCVNYIYELGFDFVNEILYYCCLMCK